MHAKITPFIKVNVFIHECSSLFMSVDTVRTWFPAGGSWLLALFGSGGGCIPDCAIEEGTLLVALCFHATLLRCMPLLLLLGYYIPNQPFFQN
jgi:hypothetical protein